MQASAPMYVVLWGRACKYQIVWCLEVRKGGEQANTCTTNGWYAGGGGGGGGWQVPPLCGVGGGGLASAPIMWCWGRGKVRKGKSRQVHQYVVLQGRGRAGSALDKWSCFGFIGYHSIYYIVFHITENMSVTNNVVPVGPIWNRKQCMIVVSVILIGKGLL